MFRPAIGLSIALLVAACGSTPSPSGSASSPGIVATDESPLPASGEAYVVTILDDDRPFFDVMVGWVR